MAVVQSPNFQFLEKHQPLLLKLAGLAEKNVFSDPNTSLYKLRQFGEALSKEIAASVGVYVSGGTRFVDIVSRLEDHGILSQKISQIFTSIRRTGNKAVHEYMDSQVEALFHLRLAHKLAGWYHRTFQNSDFELEAFIPPPNPQDAKESLQQQLDDLREEFAEAKNSNLQSQTELAFKVYQALQSTWTPQEESEETLAKEQAEFESHLEQLQSKLLYKGEELDKLIQFAQTAGEEVELSEADTRRLIDEQLREAGWKVDSNTLKYSQGTRPQKGVNMAISEWPTGEGPADYVLFVGLTPVGVVEAKKQSKDVSASLGQSKRYSRHYEIKGDETPAEGSPWEDYKIPFLFATNGRPYLRQLRTKSGIWFLDVRRKTNLSRPLSGWYTPEGLKDLLEQDHEKAEKDMSNEPMGYLSLREYQTEAIAALEKAITEGKREMLLAMATGTGKTRTCIGLVYRLIKSNRFRRILFLVDRSALGEQAGNAFKETKLENLQTFDSIYEMKGLDDKSPEDTTRLHITTIQGLIRRVLYTPDGESPLPIDTYDCIVVDECHRGYNLDQEMTEAELEFRDEDDYVSKYRRAIEHFDAVKIGLTATPAQHTTEIFGQPIYQYSYRQAVIDGFLVDHEPPIRMETHLANSGIEWAVGEEVEMYDPGTGQIDLYNTPDKIFIEVDKFNKAVLTENFNRAICGELTKHIDPSLPGKTLVFCVNDQHADVVVDVFKQALKDEYGQIEDDAVVKITGAADRPRTLIRRYKNERLPRIAVTVDLLTTGIDVPEITHIVFLRRVQSRILYEQMLGRATRLCPNMEQRGEDKQFFRIYDAVDIYSALQDVSSMKPVVVKPKIPFSQLVKEVQEVTDDNKARNEFHEQLLGKFQRKKRALKGEKNDQFETLTEGLSPEEFLEQVLKQGPQVTADWFQGHPHVVTFLDDVKEGGVGGKVYVSQHEDQILKVERGYGDGKKPEDYLDSFREYIETHKNEIPALLAVTQRPRDLTRKALKELKVRLDQDGFSEINIRTAWKDKTNQDIAASIIGYIRTLALGSPLVPYEERVENAMDKILSGQDWSAPQRSWLKRIGKQLKKETIVDREVLNGGAFKTEGGFDRLNKVFDGKLDKILDDLNQEIWGDAG